MPGARRTFRADTRDDVFLPADADAFVRVEGHLRAARVDPVKDGIRRVVVDPRPTAVVRLLGLGADDTLDVQGHYGIEATEPARAWAVRRSCAGPADRARCGCACSSRPAAPPRRP